MKKIEEIKEVLSNVEVIYRTGDYAAVEKMSRMILEEIALVPSTMWDDMKDRLSLHAWALNLITGSLHQRGMSNEAILSAEDVIKLATEAENKVEMAKAFGHLGRSHDHLSNYLQALKYYQKALVISEEIGAQNIRASNLGNIGSTYESLSDYPNALEYMQQSLDVYQEIGRKDGVAANLGNIGGVYLSLSDYSRALEYFQKALAISEEIGAKHSVAGGLGRIGLVHLRLSDIPLALEYLHKSLALFKEVNDKSGVATGIGNIGIAYVAMKEYSLGLEYYLEALAINSKLSNNLGAAANLCNIGEVYSRKDYEGYDAEKAEENLLKAITLCEEIGARKALIECYQQMIELYENEKRWEESQKYFRKFYNLEKEIQGEESAKALNLIEQRRQTNELEKNLAVERAEASATKKLLHNTLPPEIADRILAGEKIADSHQNVSVLFADIVGFTQLSSKLPAGELIDILDIVFTRFDTICKKHGLEKIKTIGDAYMAVCGAPVAVENHAERTALAALEMLEDFSMEQRFSVPIDLGFRIGLHSGSVVAGIIGENKYSYDLWGDAVNTASRMESHGEEDKIHVSEEFKHAVETLHATSLQFIRRGEMDIKGKGIMKTYFLQKATL